MKLSLGSHFADELEGDSEMRSHMGHSSCVFAKKLQLVRIRVNHILSA
jgi:hypothetical protein